MSDIPAKKVRRKRLGEILVDAGCVAAKDMEKAIEEAKASNTKLGRFLVGRGLCTEMDIAIASE